MNVHPRLCVETTSTRDCSNWQIDRQNEEAEEGWLEY
jgi:hypothetical protein